MSQNERSLRNRLSITSNDHKLRPITGELIRGLDMYLSAEKYIYENATEVKNVLAKNWI